MQEFRVTENYVYVISKILSWICCTSLVTDKGDGNIGSIEKMKVKATKMPKSIRYIAYKARLKRWSINRLKIGVSEGIWLRCINQWMVLMKLNSRMIIETWYRLRKKPTLDSFHNKNKKNFSYQWHQPINRIRRCSNCLTSKKLLSSYFPDMTVNPGG